jgi:N-acetylglutamate synthase-like GNAT family acetyltransferase
MIVRKANNADIPAIVDLLKSSLGEGLIKKTEEVWNFKHLNNPFGQSHVLVAEEDKKIIGLRAFMQWRWQYGMDILTAYRAVDTATDPQHQGIGIFKKLTLQALKDVRGISKAFIFNTPNDKSRPGYLKMGWKVIGHIKLAIIPCFLYWPFYFFSKKATYSNQINNGRLDELCEMQNQQLAGKQVFFTPKSTAYFKWRFENNPMQDYVIFSTSNWYIALYIKRHSYFNELRIVELIAADAKRDYKEIQKALINFSMVKSCLLITLANKNLFKISVYGKFGPKLTFMDLTDDPAIVNASGKIENWDYQLGDLELF